MLKYPCLILDHDDTVVQSEATVNYPYFYDFLDKIRPGTRITPEEYTEGCYKIGFVEMCRQRYHFTDQELAEEYTGWKEYMKVHVPDLFPGIKELICRHKAEGGILCVVSHSTEKTISRDYQVLIGLQPDDIYGWNLPEHQRKPNAYPLEQIMQKYHLSPDQLLVIDDMKTGWEMASKCNVTVAFAGWGRTSSPDITAEMSTLCAHSFYTTNQLYQFLFEE